MTIEVSCPQCAKRYQVDDNFAGRKAKCKACGAQMTIPAPVVEEIETYSIEPLPSTPSLIDEWNTSQQDVASKPLPPLQRPTPEPPPRKTKQKNTKAAWQMPSFELDMSWRALRLVFALIAIGIGLLFCGYREWRLASHSKSTPQKMTLAQLVANGPGDNIYIDLSEFCLLPDNSVIESDGDDLENSLWSYVWIPAVPCDQNGQPVTQQIRVIVGTKNVSRAKRLGDFCQRTTLRGMVVNETDNIKSKAHQLLKESMPGVNVAACHFFREGESPASKDEQTAYLAGGSLALFAGIALVCFKLFSRYS